MAERGRKVSKAETAVAAARSSFEWAWRFWVEKVVTSPPDQPSWINEGRVERVNEIASLWDDTERAWREAGVIS